MQGRETFVQDVLQSHYDPTYTQSMERDFTKVSAISAGFIGCGIDNLVDSLLPEFVPTS